MLISGDRVQPTAPLARSTPTEGSAPAVGRNDLPVNAPVGFAQNDVFEGRAGRPTGAEFHGKPPTENDGAVVGGDGLAYPAGTSPADVPATQPADGPGTGTVIYVNGQGASPETISEDMQAVADATNRDVVGVYNATEGFIGDTAQSLQDKLDRGNNPAIATTSDLVYEALQNGEEVNLLGHSQGGIIIARALEDVKGRLMADGMTDAQAEQALSNVSVETMGGAASRYPDGPEYTHYINQADFVPRELGLGETSPPFFDLSPNKLGVDSHPGRDANVIEFNDGGFFDRMNPGGEDHALSTYLAQYRAPEDVATHPDLVEVPERGAGDTVRDVVNAVANPVGTAVNWARGLFG